MNHPVQIAVQLQPQHASYEQLRDAVRRSEDIGIDIIFNWDHFFPLYGDPNGKHFEGMTTIAAWAEQTSRVQLGNLVICNSYRNPNLLADMVRTIDHISDGRFIFGIGSGWFERDYDEYGYEFGTAGSRLDDLAKNLPIILSRFDKLNPPPTRKIPVLIGGGGEKKTLPLVAQYADIWHYFMDKESYDKKTALLKQYCERIGRDPQEIVHSTNVDGGEDIHVPAKTAVELAQERYEWGVRIFTYGVTGPEYNLEPLEQLVAWRDSLGK